LRRVTTGLLATIGKRRQRGLGGGGDQAAVFVLLGHGVAIVARMEHKRNAGAWME